MDLFSIQRFFTEVLKEHKAHSFYIAVPEKKISEQVFLGTETVPK